MSTKKILISALLLGILSLVTIILVPRSGPRSSETQYADFTTLVPLDQSDGPGDKFTNLIDRFLSYDEKNIIDNVLDENFKLFSCVADGTDAKSIMLIGTYKSTATGNSFEGAKQAMLQFEDELYSEWGKLVFGQNYKVSSTPGIITEYDVQDPEVAAETYKEIKYADVSQSIYYSWVLNYLIIAPSKTCLFETMNSIYHVH